MQTDTRTRLQITADRLDMDLHRIMGRLHDFADEVGSVEVVSIASSIAAARLHVRQHMHKADRVATGG